MFEKKTLFSSNSKELKTVHMETKDGTPQNFQPKLDI